MVKLRLFNRDYFNIFDNPYDRDLECPILLLCCREESGKFHAIRVPGNKGLLRPHFFIENNEKNERILSDLLKEKAILEWDKWDYPTVYDEDEKVLVAYAQYPFQVKNLKKYFEHTYQADVPWDDLAVINLGIEQGYFEVPDGKEWIEAEEIKPLPESEHFYAKPRVLYFDIETEFVNPKKGFDLDNQVIISVVTYDNYKNEYTRIEWDDKYEKMWLEEDFVKRKFVRPEIPLYSHQLTWHCQSEKELLEKFFSVFKEKPDGIFGHNSHGGIELQSVKSESIREWSNGFDEPVIYKRAIKLGLEKEMQQMSPLPVMKNVYGRYYGVYARGKGEKFEVVIRGVTPLDFYHAEPLMKYAEKYRDFFGRSLDDYLRYFSNFHKIEHGDLTVAELKKIDLEKELLYNKVDVEGCFFLDKRFGFSNDVFDTVSLSLIKGINVLSATKIHNFLTLKESKDYCVYDTKYQAWSRYLWEGWLEEKKGEYGIVMKKKNMAGGYNIQMRRGSSGWTVAVDFSAFYPTLAYSANAGIDTLIQVKREFKNHYKDKKGKRWHKSQCIITPTAPFRKDKESIERKIWGKLLSVKDKYKKLYEEKMAEFVDPNHPQVKLYWSKVYNLKGRLINNKYGASGNKGYKARCLPVYNVQPTLAQCCIKGIEKELLPSLEYKAKCGDTDSIMIQLNSSDIESAVEESEKLVEKANDFINEFLKREFNIDDNIIKLGWEKIAPKFYGHKKKNYAMEVWAEDGKILSEEKRYVMYKGFKLKKRDRSDATELVQKIYLGIGLKNLNKAEFLAEITEFIKRIEAIFPLLKWSKICSRITIKKNLGEYQKNWINRRAAEFANEAIGANYGKGSRGFFGYLKIDGNNRLDPVVMFNEEDERKLKKLGYELDYEKHKQSFVIDKLDLLLDDYGTNYRSLLNRARIKNPISL